MALPAPFKSALAVAGTLATLAAAPFAIAPASAAVITLNIAGCTTFELSGSGGNQTLTCVTDTAPGAPTGCSASASPSSLASGGGGVMLSASCSGGTTANTVYTWSKNSSTFATGASASDTLPANGSASTASYSYSVQACNGAACSSAATTVSVAGTSGGGGGPIACSGFDATRVIDLPWKSGRNVLTNNFGGFRGNDAVVVRITVPAGLRSLAPGAIKMGEWGGGPVNRYATLTTTPCDFAGRTRFVDFFSGTSIEVPLAVGSPAPVPGIWGASLQPGQVYYLNVRNTNDKGVPSCVGGTCNLFVEFNPFPTF